jgi:hypothetical protein
MERYIDRLKNVSQAETLKEVTAKKEKERLSAENPCVVCSVTMGKEPHAGHLFLITMAGQMQSGLGSVLPVMLINNNTGPRSAEALINFARQKSLPLTEAAALMNGGSVEANEIVTAYRARKDNSPEQAVAMEILSGGDYDIFSTIASETEDLLKFSGFNVQIASESKLLKLSADRTKSLSPEWETTGFTPFRSEKRIVVLEKAGSLTATGTLFTSISALAEGLQADLMLMVDSMPDASDAGLVLSSIPSLGNCTQVPGAGVGFGGEIASGTKGEALTIREIAEKFYGKRPNGNLKSAALFLTLTRPLSLPKDNPNLAESFFDFKDNSALVSLLIKCNDESLTYKQSIVAELENLEKKMASNSSSLDKSIEKIFPFLPQKAESLFAENPERIMAASKKIEILSLPDLIKSTSSELGYGSGRDNPYLSAKRVLAIRKNHHLSTLTGLLSMVKKIETVSAKDFGIICKMIEFCVERMGL